MPKFDMDQESARVVEWVKNEGDFVELDEIVLVVETDKVAIDVPAPAAGHLARITAQEGDDVPVTTVIAYLLDDGESEDDLPPLEKLSDQIGTDSSEPSQQARSHSIQREAPLVGHRRVIATPLAQRMARNVKLDLSKIESSGERITKSDIERYLTETDERKRTGKVPATPAARRLGRELDIDIFEVPGSGPGGRVHEADIQSYKARIQTATYESRGVANRIPLTGMRKTIADKMQRSFQLAPHIALTIEVDVSRFEKEREHLNVYASQNNKEKVSLTALLVKVIGWALTRHPMLNASLVADEILVWDEINIGVATALEEGLIVPVIHSADQLSVHEINLRLRAHTNNARDGHLALADVQDGTFTVTNLGMYGIDQFRAIINPPESAILAVGRVIRKPLVINDLDEVEVRAVMNLTLSADHRVVDGVTAARFLAELGQGIENPDMFLIDRSRKGAKAQRMKREFL